MCSETEERKNWVDSQMKSYLTNHPPDGQVLTSKSVLAREQFLHDAIIERYWSFRGREAEALRQSVAYECKDALDELGRCAKRLYAIEDIEHQGSRYRAIVPRECEEVELEQQCALRQARRVS